jgi:exosortase C (VPDSG-CTERM-specific)
MAPSESKSETSATDSESGSRAARCSPRIRQIAWIAFGIVLCVGFARPLLSLFSFAASTPLYSYILGVPVCCAYLLYTIRDELPRDHPGSPFGAILFGIAGVIAWIAAYFLVQRQADPLWVNTLSVQTFSFVCICFAAGFAFRGRKWMTASAFPACFLLFLIPLPTGALTWMETSLQRYSADAAAQLFHLLGTPVVRDGFVFDLPGFSLQVAQECSGIQASWILFVSTVLVSYLFLRSPWRRAILIAAVIPLGIIRNGIRIVTIGLLCVHKGPQIADSFIHKRGGPIFLALSLIPFAILLWWLQKTEKARTSDPDQRRATSGTI